MAEPRERMRRHDLLAWLDSKGLGTSAVRKLIVNRTIRRYYLPGDKKAYYLRSQVETDVLNETNHKTK